MCLVGLRRRCFCIVNFKISAESAELITEQEVKLAIKQMKKGKAAGPSGVTAEMLQAAGEAGIRWVTEICNAILKEGKVPEDWERSWIVSVYKGKGDALECGSYRGIKLLDQVMKVMERVIEKRIRSRVHQFGFRPGRGMLYSLLNAGEVPWKEERVVDGVP